jgi:uncharacterized protein
MNRKDEEVLNPVIIQGVLNQCKIAHIGIHNGEDIYIVPVNYGFTYEDGKITLYTHGAPKGLRWDLMKKNPRVGFELDTGYFLEYRGEDAPEYGNWGSSIIGTGTAIIVEDATEKRRILENLMKVQSGKDFNLDDLDVSHVNVAKIVADQFTCKTTLPLANKRGNG